HRETILTNVRVKDPTNSDCATTVASLAAGASETASCTSSKLTSSLTNTASVIATPPFGDPNLTQSSTATVTPAKATPALSVVKEVCSTDGCDEDAAANEGGWAKTTAVDYFGSVTWRVTVTNTGETPVTGITVQDELAPGCAVGPFDLARGASHSITCESEQLTADLTNEAVASGSAPDAVPVTQTDSATVTVGEKPASSMTVVKEACNPLVNDCADSSAVGSDGWSSAGQVVFEGEGKWRVSVTNTGSTTLTNVRAVDASSPECSFVVASLAPGASKTVTCEASSVSSVVTNTATITATPPFGDPDLSETVSATLTPAAAVPGVVFVKEVCPLDQACEHDAGLGKGGWSDAATVDYDGSVQWRLTVVNSGQTVLTSVVVSDPMVLGCASDELGPIARGEQASVVCETNELRADLLNTATASVTDSLSNVLSQEASASVTIGTPKPESGITLQKESCDPAASGCSPDAAIGADGWSTSTLVPFLGASKWRVTVTNSGETTLTNVRVSDELAQGCALTVDSLSSSESISKVCDEAPLDGTITNEASVLATPPFGDPDLSDTASATTRSQEPLVLLTISHEICTLPAGCDPDAPSLTGGWETATQVEPGESVTWRVVVSNEGQVPLTGVVVTDVTGLGCSATIGDLASGAVSVVTCTTDGLLETIIGEATVSATNPRNGDTIEVPDTNGATATVRDFAAAVSVTKQACFVSEDADCAPDGTGWNTHAIGDFGAELWWKITVTNTGDTVLRDVSVVDTKFPAGDTDIAELGAGESKSIVFSAGAWKELDPNADSAQNDVLVSAVDIAGKQLSDDSLAVASVTPAPKIPGSESDGTQNDGVEATHDAKAAAAASALTVTGGAENALAAGLAVLMALLGLVLTIGYRRRTS
ncbi:DUF7617 domain-containing protein, partial [Lysinibacter cavernae]|uniref:DUF7617 domain-containing protein n=1 Tax=Lysinibacter cavernae TaxID=1640652 RepID=UPI001ABB4154